MNIHQITATTNTEVPAQGAKTFDRYWMTHFLIIGPSPDQPVAARLVLRKARVTDTGLELLSIDHPDGAPIEVSIADLLAAAATDPALAQLVNDTLQTVDAIAKSMELI
jgi:hypothetical protein